MKPKLSIFILAIASCLLVKAGGDAYGQARFKIPIVYTDSLFDEAEGITFLGLHVDTIWFGYHDLASVCRDTLSGFTTHWTLVDTGSIAEEELPPPPPSKFDIHFNAYNAVSQGCFTNGSKYDIRRYLGVPHKDTMQFIATPHADAEFHRLMFEWPNVLSQYFDSCRITKAGGFAINVDMLTQGKFQTPVFSTSLAASLTYKIIPSNPKIPPPTTPTVNLLTPANGAVGQPQSLTLTWAASSGALFYRIQVSRGDPNFNTPSMIANDSLGSGTLSKSLINLLSGTTYYWRVAVFTTGGVSYFQNPAFSFTTLFLTLPTILDAPVNNAVNVSPTPTLQWHEVGTTGPPYTYHVQVKTDTNLAATVVNDSTLTVKTKVVTLQNCFTYWWHARTKNTAGWGPFSGWNKFRVALATPSMPVMVSPLDGATGVVLSPTLSWQNDVCTDSTRIQVTTDTLGTPVYVYNQRAGGTSKQINPLAQNTTYFWRLTSFNSIPDSSQPTGWRQFTTLLLPPATPGLLLPADLDSSVSLSPTFSWSSVSYADTYTLKVYRDQAFTQKIFDDSSLTVTSQAVAGLENCTRYYWRVKAKNVAGSSAFSGTRSFKTVKAAPGAAPLLSPANGQINVPDNLRLIWSRPDICTDYFIVTLSRDTNFTTTVSRDSTIDTTIVVGPLLALTKYFWRVDAYNKPQGTSAYNEFSFIVTDQTPPGAPVLSSPANGQDGLPLTFTLRWDSTDKATTYRVQVAFDSLFTLLYVNDSTVHQSSAPGKQIGPLLNTHSYWWRVNAKNQKGTGPYSEIWKFSTLAPPSAPVLISPGNGATNVSISPQFVWTIPDRADSYRLQLSYNAAFTNLVRDDSTIVTNNWAFVGQLQGLRTYYWRVFGKNAIGYGDTSIPFSFTTQRLGAPNWAIPISICETGPACDTLYFAINPGATYGIDYALGEYELPQPPPSGWFDVRFVDSRVPPLIGEGLRTNVHPFWSYSQVDTFKVKFQPGLGSYPIIVSWDRALISPICDSMIIKDEYTGAIVNQRMDLVSSVSTSLSSLLIIEYGAFPTPLGVKPPAVQVPKGFTLSQNYPNPFNPTTRLDFSTEKGAFISVIVYDMLGREVAVLANEAYGPGIYHAAWNGMNEHGQPMPSGIYYVRMLGRSSSEEDAPYLAVRKIIMMK